MVRGRVRVAVNIRPRIQPPLKNTTFQGGVIFLSFGLVPPTPGRGRQPEDWSRRDRAKISRRILPRRRSYSSEAAVSDGEHVCIRPWAKPDSRPLVPYREVGKLTQVEAIADCEKS